MKAIAPTRSDTGTGTRTESAAAVPATEPHTFRLNAVEVLAGTLAAVSAAAAGSALGVAGTLWGAALGSIVAAVGTTIYSHSLAVTRDGWRNRRRMAAGPAARGGEPAHGTTYQSTAAAPVQKRRRPWILAGAAVLTFTVALAVVTMTELAIGKPLSNVYGHDAARQPSVVTVWTDGSALDTGPAPQPATDREGTPPPQQDSSPAPPATPDVTEPASPAPEDTGAPAEPAPEDTGAPAEPAPTGSSSGGRT